jgi:hypothetical protein
MSAGNAVVPLSDGTTALISSDGVEPVTLTQPPVGGSNRNDLIVATVRDSTVDAGTNDDFVFTAIAGVVNGGVPATPANSIAIASILVTGGQNWITPAQVTDRRRMLGLNIPPPLGAGAPFASFTDNNGEVWVAKGGVNGGVYRKARDVLHCRVWRNAALTMNGATNIAMDATGAPFDPFGLLGGGGIIVPVAGVYAVFARLNVTPTAGGQWAGLWLYVAGANTAVEAFGHSSGAFGMGVTIADTVRAGAGQAITMQGNGAVAMTVAPGNIQTWMTASYLGTG